MGLFRRATGAEASSVAERLAGRTVHVLDVRQPAEWRKGHIPGSLNLPLPRLGSRLAQLPNDKTIIAVCASGHRSAVAARTLGRAGYQVENLKGGMRSWTRAGLPIEPAGRKTR